MAAPLMPSPLDYIGPRRFAFYPPIRHADANSWILGASSWSEVQVINSETGREIWVPRQYVGAVSDNQDALTVGLTQQLDFRNGNIIPRADRRVLEMPKPAECPFAPAPHGPANVIGIRTEPKARRTFQSAPFRVGIFVLFVIGLLALVESASR
jgi:hypothetical protein